MAASTDALTIYRGEKKVWRVTVTDINGARIDTSGAAFYMTVRATIPSGTVTSDLGGNASGIYVSASLGTGITALTPTTSGQIEITVGKGSTSALNVDAFNSPTSLYYGLEYVPNGETEPRTLAQGPFLVYADIVRAV